jgi:hypothetical protein
MFNSVFAAPVLLQALVILVEGRVKGREYWMLDRGLPGPIVVCPGGIVVAVPRIVESGTPPPCEFPAAVVEEAALAVDVVRPQGLKIQSLLWVAARQDLNAER